MPILYQQNLETVGHPQIGGLFNNKRLVNKKRGTVSSSLEPSYTLRDTFGTDVFDGIVFANTSTRTYVTSEVVVGSDYTITKIELRMLRVDGGGVAGDLVCEIRGDTGTAPDTPPLATSTNTIVSADVSTGQVWVAFLFTGLSVTNGTHYYIGVKASSVDAANYYTGRGGVLSSGDVQNSTAGTVSWSALGTRQWYQRTYSSP